MGGSSSRGMGAVLGGGLMNTNDTIKNPRHYCFGEIEVIDFIDQIVAHYPPELGFYLANVIKYVSRAPHKGKLSEDLSKAEFYLKRAINKSVALKPKVQRD